jgi:hypothetical protein
MGNPRNLPCAARTPTVLGAANNGVDGPSSFNG